MKKELLKLMFRSVAWTLIFCLPALFIGLFIQTKLSSVAIIINLIFIVQSAMIVQCLLKPGKGILTTCSTTGYSRLALINHIMLTLFIAIFITWLCIAVPVFTNLRSIIQIELLENPMYFIIHDLDIRFIVKELLFIIPFSLILLFAEINKRQPGNNSSRVSFYILTLIGLLLITTFGESFLFPYFRGLYNVFIIFICLFSVMLVTYSTKIFSTMEISGSIFIPKSERPTQPPRNLNKYEAITGFIVASLTYIILATIFGHLSSIEYFTEHGQSLLSFWYKTGLCGITISSICLYFHKHNLAIGLGILICLFYVGQMFMNKQYKPGNLTGINNTREKVLSIKTMLTVPGENKTFRPVDNPWATLKYICRKAQEEKHYYTHGKYSKIMEAIAPLLPEDRLVELTLKHLKSSSRLSISPNGKGYGQKLYFSSKIDENAILKQPVIIAPLLHACLLKDMVLDATEGDNIIERKIVPELLNKRRSFKPYQLPAHQQIALKLGGSITTRYVDSQCIIANRRRNHSFLYSLTLPSSTPHPWIRYLFIMTGPEGKFLRQKYHSRISALDSLPGKRYLQFDENWEGSLAERYWQFYMENDSQKGSEISFKSHLSFLKERPFPVPLPAYIECYRHHIKRYLESKEDDLYISQYPESLEKLSKTDRVTLFQTLTKEIEESANRLSYEEDRLNKVLKELKTIISELDKQDAK